MPPIRIIRTVICGISILLFTIPNAHGQNIKSLQKKVKELLSINAYEDALPVLLQLDSIIPLNAEINYLAGICCLHLQNASKSIRFLEKAEALNYNSPQLYYNMGKTYHVLHKFEKAIIYFEKFQAIYRTKDTKGDEKIIEVNRYISNCRNGIELQKNAVKATIYNLGPNINTPNPEYVPLISVDESFLIFSSKRFKQTANAKSYDEDIYVSQKDSIGLWLLSSQLENTINTNGHEAGIALSPSGQKLYIYKDQGNGDIFESQLHNSAWSTPKKLPSPINSNFWEPSASISSSEDVIYFSSNRPGGFGGTDLYVSKKTKEGNWGEARNLGGAINTILNEDAPFIHPDGKTLFFSSEGHNSIGGHDIFKTIIDSNHLKWSDPVNIGYPINTAGDDDFFVWSADGRRAYFSSSREGGYGDKDIYRVEMPQLTANLVLLKGKLYAGGKDDVQKIILTVTDLKKSTVVSKIEFDNVEGSYSVVLNQDGNYFIQAEAKGFLPFSENVEVASSALYNEIVKDIALEPLKVGSKSILRNVFFDSGKSVLKNESLFELNNLVKILTDNPSIYVEIAGHTDNVGNTNENLKLSFDRARAVKEFIKSQGIVEERLLAVGYGEQFAIQTNDSEESRQANRRTEFIIIQKPSSTNYKGFYFHK